MRFISSKKTKKTIGLDIGSSLIKLIQLKHTVTECTLINAGIAPLLPHSIVDGEIVDSQQVASTIKSLFKQLSIKPKNVVTAISSKAVIVKRIIMDKMTPHETRLAIGSEAAQHVPFDIKDVIIDFQVLDTKLEDDKMEVLLVAAKTEMINSHLKLLHEADINPVIIDVDSFALQNAFEYNYSPQPQQCIAIVNIGSQLTNINIVFNRTPYLVRDLSLAGDTFSETIKTYWNLNDEQATALLRGTGVKDIIPGSLPKVLESLFEELAISIERSFSFVKSELDTDTIHTVVLSGGNAKISGLADYLHSRLDLPVKIADPLKAIDILPEVREKELIREARHMFMLPIGLALRKIGE